MLIINDLLKYKYIYSINVIMWTTIFLTVENDLFTVNHNE